MFIFYALLPYMFVCNLFAGLSFVVVVLGFIFSFGRQKSYSCLCWKQEFAWADSALVALDEWLSYRGGNLKSFEYSSFSLTVSKPHFFDL